MWIRLFRAELRKITGNRWVAGCLIWVFPILAILFVILMLLIVAFSSDARQGMIDEPPAWTDMMIFPWLIPNSPIGRGLLLGFTAVLFAGEYQWNTWKVIVPRSRRVPLIIVKFLAVAAFIVVAFSLMSVLLFIGGGLISLAAGSSYGPPVTGAVLSDFARDYGLQMANTFIGVILAAGYAALAAMITRSILGSVITAIVATFLETLLLIPLALLSLLLDLHWVFLLYRYTPTYNLLNLFIWLSGDEPPTGLETPWDTVVNNSMEFSLVVLIAWVIGLVSLTAYLFYRQDITN